MNQSRPPTMAQQMLNSKYFKVLVAIFLGSLLVMIVCVIVADTAECKSSHKLSCQYWYTYFTNSCSIEGREYCCYVQYQNCGESGSCLYHPRIKEVCWGWLVMEWIFSILSLLLALICGFMVLVFRIRAKRSSSGDGKG